MTRPVVQTAALSRDDVERAAGELARHVRKTPLVRSDVLDRQAGVKIWLKAENLQRTGSFKLRGAMLAVSRVPAAERRHGFLTYSSGNHGHALALGMHMRALMAEMMGKQSGCCKGKGGSMHMTAAEVGLLGANAIVGAQLPIAVGAALTYQVKGLPHAAIAEVLRIHGYEVRVAGTVAEGIKLAAEGFDVLVSDIGLPDGTGRDLMKQLCERQPVKGIALTGYGMERDIDRNAGAGFARHLTKPVDPRDLLAAIGELARGRRNGS